MMKEVSSPVELFELLKKGNGNRTQHPTDANAESSRSHAVFQIYVNMTNRISGERRIAKLSMIDLAGSERGAATGCVGMRFTEGANINKSLLALGNCINSLADGQRHVPYRDSKLTRLLKDSLGGNCQTVMIANISPSSLNYEDTYNTLKYATRAKKIQANVKKNVVKSDLTIPQYKKLVEELKKKNEELELKLKEEQLKMKDGRLKCESATYTCSDKESHEDLSRPTTSKSLSSIVTDSLESCSWRDELRQYFKEKQDVQRQILKLECAEKSIKLKLGFKESTEYMFKGLCTDTEQLEVGRTRIASTVDTFQQQLSEISSQLKNLRNLQSRLDGNIQIMTIDSDEQVSSEIQLHSANLERVYAKLKLEYLDKVVELYHHELEQRDKIEMKMADLLQPYYTMHRGYGHLTDDMENEYRNLLRLVQGLRTVTWQDEEDIIPDQVESKDSGIEACSVVILSTGKHASMKEQLSHIEKACTNRRNAIKRKLYDSDFKSISAMDLVKQSSVKKQVKSETDLNEVLIKVEEMPPDNLQLNSTFLFQKSPASVKKEISLTNMMSTENILPKVSKSKKTHKVKKHIIGSGKSSRIISKENQGVSSAKSFGTMGRAARFPLLQKEQQTSDAALKITRGVKTANQTVRLNAAVLQRLKP